jgi:1,4-alpha-glucan branching enzyme
VSHPVQHDGLGFTHKWNMGWMHDTLQYFAKDPLFRSYEHDKLTFGLLYAWSENFILPLSHDEVVHGKGSLLGKMPGDRWQKLANLRALYGWMWAHPGKKLLFMGGEIAQGEEWSEQGSLDWYVLDYAPHAGVMRLVADLNRVYRLQPALWEVDFVPSGFSWLEGGRSFESTLAFARFGTAGAHPLVALFNFSPVVQNEWRVGLPRPGDWREVLNTDASVYGGSGVGNPGRIQAEQVPWSGQEQPAAVVLPPLATIWLAPDGGGA